MLLWPENFLLCSSSHLSKVPLNSDAFSFAVVDDLHSIISNPIYLPGGKLTWEKLSIFNLNVYFVNVHCTKTNKALQIHANLLILHKL